MEKEVQQIRALRELKDMQVLLGELKDEDWQVRLRAATNLGKLRRSEEMIREVVPALILATADRNEYVRRAAVPSLATSALRQKTRFPL